jgi:hypothetical protein
MATFINLILKTENEIGDSNSPSRKAAIESQLALMAGRQPPRFF